jgi:hypothetical protein
MYGEAVTPNLHKLALQFGVLDNFFDSGEVSGDGHVWSTAAIGTDYLEKTWEQNYRGGQRTYDWEGMVADGYPLEQKIADVAEPASGYLWGDLAKHGKSYYHFGEFISTTFCDEVKTANPQAGPQVAGPSCARKAIGPGEAIPEEWGGGVNKWPWAIPLIASNVATKPELVGHFAEEAPDFELMVPDQVRVEIFLRHLKGWIADKAKGKDTMPSFVMLRLPNDHTAGTRAGAPTPKASLRTTTWRWDGPWRRFRIRLSGRYGVLHSGGRCAGWRRPRGCAQEHWAGGEQVFAAGGLWRGVCGQPVLFDGERGADDGDAAGAAADEQQRCVCVADFADFCGAGGSGGVYGGYVEPRQRADLHGECEDRAGGEGEREDGLSARGSRGCREAERDFVAGRDGGQAGAGDA